MIHYRTLATVSAAVMFVYFLICSLITSLFPDFSFRMYALAFHGIKLTNLEADILTLPEALLGALFYASMTWALVCSVGWLYNLMAKK